MRALFVTFIFLFSPPLFCQNQVERMQQGLSKIYRIAAQEVVKNGYQYFKILHCTGVGKKGTTFSFSVSIKESAPCEQIFKIESERFKILIACFSRMYPEDPDIMDAQIPK